MSKQYTFEATILSKIGHEMIFYVFLEGWLICNSSAMAWYEQVKFDEMITMFALYKTNTLSWIIIVLAHWNNSPRLDMSLHLGHIIMILSSYCLYPCFCI